MHTVEFLKALIGFPTISADPNDDLIAYCADLLRETGAEVVIIKDPDQPKANLYATIGPTDRPGVLLSGHTDVVPVAGQSWSMPPFALTERDGKFYGRGTADMKGFVASALSAALRASKMELKTPLHLALSYDEEVGCLGVRSLIDMLAVAPFRPQFCIVGEPTQMMVATGHKGKTACRVVCTGREGHSALAPTALNAIHLVCDMVSAIRAIQADISRTSVPDDDYDVTYSTLHVGRISGGVALNIVPNTAEFLFEIRNLPADDPQAILERLKAAAEDLLAPLRRDFPEANIVIETTGSYPPLSTAQDAEVVRFVKSLTGQNATLKLAFGTEGGLFSTQLDIPTVICGPGSMAQGHRPDEFVSADQLAKCDAMLDALLDRLGAGL
ncbi:acetylornithine deacetylase [uncultured Thioclava sp.]|uniref:acetylornithine deacetylase n=1 Tax=uncultured Thioclava sp. TaxID=473858 RepID=UPI0025E936EC|nr:acetylornithine deacetylase [uncultured Thioclava sp.]